MEKKTMAIVKRMLMERQQSRCKWGEITEQGENSPSQLISLKKVLAKKWQNGVDEYYFDD